MTLPGMASKAHREKGQQPDSLVYVAGGTRYIEIYGLDLTGDTLKRRAKVPIRSSGESVGATYLARNPHRRFMYALDRLDPPHIVSLSIKGDQNDWAAFHRTRLKPGSPPHLQVHPSGRWIFAVHYNKEVGYVSVLPIRTNGIADSPVQTQKVGKKTHMVMVDPTGKYVFVPCTDSDFVAQFRFDSRSGQLEPNDPAVSETGKGTGPRHMAFHSTGPFAYVINETNSTLSSWHYDSTSGRLSGRETLDTLPPGFGRSRNSCAHVLVHPSGKFVYGSNRGHDSIVIFRVDPKTGRLARIGWERGGGLIKTPRNFTIDRTGQLLLVANQDSDSILVFQVGSDGLLTRIGKPVSTGEKPSFIGMFDSIP